MSFNFFIFLTEASRPIKDLSFFLFSCISESFNRFKKQRRIIFQILHSKDIHSHIAIVLVSLLMKNIVAFCYSLDLQLVAV